MKTEQFDNQLLQIDRFIKMPQMLPWVGENYGKDYKKVLFLGESHYFPKGSNIHLDSKIWYNLTHKDLTWDEVYYTTTRDALWINYKKNQIWRDTSAIMHDCGISFFDENENIFDHFAFYNFYLRPAQNEGDQLYINEKDIIEANNVFEKIFHILKPDVIIFLSSKSWNNFQNKNNGNAIFEFTAHPSSAWWNQKANRYKINDSEALSGAEKFKRLITDIVLKDM